MKKIYFQPSTEIVEIKAPSILAGSPKLQNDEISAGSIEGRSDDFDWDD